MISRLDRRVQKIEEKVVPNRWFTAIYYKFPMDYLRKPDTRERTKPNYVIKEPDFKTCCDYGHSNVEVVKAVRKAKAEGKIVKKYEIKFV
jgi:hypothetical protein